MRRHIGWALASVVSLGIGGLGAASAADMPVKARPLPVPVVAVYNWTGFYIGANAGYGWGENTNPFISFTDPGGLIGYGPYFAAGGNVFPNLKPRGFIGGGQLGVDGQWGNFVAGVVADFQWADIKASGTAAVTPPGFVPTTQSLTQKLDFLGTARARAGFAANNWLFYGTGGVAYGEVKSSLTFSSLPVSQVFAANSNTETRVGWAAGAGVNYGFTNWVVGLEWLHYDLGRSTVTALNIPPFAGGSLTGTQRVAGDIVRGTVSYKFNWAGPVVAKY
jgi:outer membrane immunogenic protein